MGGFRDSIIGGVGNLIRDWIQSVPFVSGSTGWRISRDGTAEFNNATFRGSVIIQNNGKILIYSTPTPQANKLLIALTPVAGNDGVGNSYSLGLNLYDALGAATGEWGGDTGFQLDDPSSRNLAMILSVPIQLFPRGYGVADNDPPTIKVVKSDVVPGDGTLQILGPLALAGPDPGQSRIIEKFSPGATNNGADWRLVFRNTAGGDVTLLDLIQTLFTINKPTRMNDKLTISQSNPGGGLTIFQNVNTSTNPGTISIQETAANNGSIGLFVSGDAHARMVIRASGKIELGDGTNAADTMMQRASAGLWEILQSLKVDGTITATGGTATNPTLITTDTWVTASLGAGWGNIAGLQTVQYRLTTDNMIEIVGGVQTTSATPSAVIFTLDANHLPTVDQRVMGAVERISGGDVAHAVDIGTGGAFTILNNLTVSGRALYIYARIPKS